MESKHDTAPLIQPQSSAIVDIPFHKSGHTVKFQTTASDGRLPYIVARNHGSGGRRALAYCILAIAVCAGFALLYVKMSCMQQQIYDLQSELSVVGGAGWQDPLDYGELPSDAPGNQEHDDMGTEADSEQNERKRGRRSTHFGTARHGGGHSRHALSSQTHPQPGHITSHLLPVVQQTTDYSSSEWFRWTSNGITAHMRGMQLTSGGTKIIVPISGYYFVYSQVTLGGRDNRQLSVGHRIVKNGFCGTASDLELVKSLTSQSGTENTYRDSKHLAGVFYLEKFDELGVRPYFPSGRHQGSFSIDQQNSYFGLILLSNTPSSSPVCARRRNY